MVHLPPPSSIESANAYAAEPLPLRHSWRGGRFDDEDEVLHSGVRVSRFVGMHVMGAIFPITAGWLLFGWRAIGAIAIVLLSALIGGFVWRSVGLRGHRLKLGQVAWMSLLLALTLPAQLLSSDDLVSGFHVAPWPILAAAGLTISTLLWLLGGTGSGRIHPVIITHLLLVVFFQDSLSPQFALKRLHAFWGDLLEAPRAVTRDVRTAGGPSLAGGDAGENPRAAWITAPQDQSGFQAIRAMPAAERLESFTGGHQAPDRAWISLESLIRDRLPPMEDLIVGGQPAPIGQGSAIALIIGGLFLLYRGLIDYRVPLLILVSAFAALLILPVPILINESAKIWKWLALRDPGVGWPLGVTFANYEVMASPLLFTSFFLATSPGVRPMIRRARIIYAVLVGITSAGFQLYVSVAIGPYLALLTVSLIAPFLDRAFRPRLLV